jgi:glycosyltransferase involved in cell wall biosynthesis
MSDLVTVAIPVLNGGHGLERTLAAVTTQQIDRQLELVVCDSGSRDGSVQIARCHGAAVIEIAPEHFSHGRTRNLLMERSRGSHVAFLTQDAVPADAFWLGRLLAGFSLAPDIGLVFGPYRPRCDASPMVARELTDWFRSLSPSEEPRIDRLDATRRGDPARSLLGPRGYFTDVNGCVARGAWQRVPFRDTAYAEDHLLAHDMMRAGYGKVYLPDAAVVHSHEYTRWDWLRRSFDEGRALRDVYDWVAPLDPRTTGLNLWGLVGADWRWIQAHRSTRLGHAETLAALAHSTTHHAARLAGAALGARSQRLTPALVRRLSLERRVG